jgi:hypothetical protein
LSRRALFHFDAVLWMSMAVAAAAASMGERP